METNRIYVSHEDGWFVAKVIGATNAPLEPILRYTEALKLEEVFDAVDDLIRTVNDWDDSVRFKLGFVIEPFEVEA